MSRLVRIAFAPAASTPASPFSRPAARPPSKLRRKPFDDQSDTRGLRQAAFAPDELAVPLRATLLELAARSLALNALICHVRIFYAHQESCDALRGAHHRNRFCFPERIVTNDDLAKIVETNDEWIRERTGITERRIAGLATRERQTPRSASPPHVRALEMAGKRPEDIDAILYGTCSPDTLVPSTACWLQQKLGATNAWAMDLNAACSGFVFALRPRISTSARARSRPRSSSARKC